MRGLRFRDAEAFFAAARDGKIDTTPLYLPPGLLKRALADARRWKNWSVPTGTIFPALALRLDDGTTLRGAFRPRGSRHPTVTVTITRPKPTTTKAAPR